MRTTTLLTGLLLAASSTAAWAFQPMITDDTGTQGEKGNQLEFAYEKDRAEQAGLTNATGVTAFTYTRGLSETLDVFVGANHIRTHTNIPGDDGAAGTGNPSLGLKWRFYENEASKTSFALKPALGLPIDEEKEVVGLGSGRISYSLTAILTQETPFGAVHANLASERTVYRNKTLNPDSSVLRVSIGPVWDVDEKWKLVLDLGSESERAGGSKTHDTFFEIGAIYSPNKDLDFAVGILRYNQNTRPSTVTNIITAGLTWRFK
ncbi:MAG: transporter [Proteobacteria bacterium]|nr:transporter [Pseudomonadota bacterium]